MSRIEILFIKDPFFISLKSFVVSNLYKLSLDLPCCGQEGLHVWIILIAKKVKAKIEMQSTQHRTF